MTLPFRLFDRYLLKTFVRFLLFALLAASAIFVVVDLIEHLDSFIDKKVPYLIVVWYYVLYLPYIVYLVLPMATLLSALFTVGNLSRTHELTAAKASGVGLYRILFHLLLVGVLLSAGNFFFGETLVPYTNRENQDLYHRRVSANPVQQGAPGRIYLRNHPGEMVRIDSYDDKTGTAHNLDYESYEGQTLVRRLNAREACWKDTAWVVNSGQLWRFHPDSTVSQTVHDQIFSDLGFTPADLVIKEVRTEPEAMGYWQLRRYVATLQIVGANTLRWNVDLAFKEAMPITCAIVILLGVPIAAHYRRSGIVLSIGMGMLISFIYFAFQQIGRVIAYNGSLSPLVAAWLGNAVFILVGGFLYLRVKK
jgi:lipopolysaccharide export system permease protein